MNLSMRDWIWIMGIVAGIATTYGMMSSRVTALGYRSASDRDQSKTR
jgi:hypothetical protein